MKLICSRGHQRTPNNLYKNGECRICHALRARQPEVMATKRDYVHSVKGKAAIKRHEKTLPWRYSVGKRNAAQRDRKYTISFGDYVQLIKNPCAYCGKIVETGHGLDRVDSSKGYELNNVVPCCGACNRHKSFDWTYEEMRVASQAIIQLRGEK